MSESLRMNPPVTVSTQLMATENLTIGNYKILKGQPMSICMFYMANSPEYWQRSEDYLPERFDPTSELFLRPDGKKRHPMCFGPFLGGKRVCLGKTFAENIGKCVVALLASQLDFSFVDEAVRNEKPPYTFFHLPPVIDLKATLAPQF